MPEQYGLDDDLPADIGDIGDDPITADEAPEADTPDENEGEADTDPGNEGDGD